MKVKANGIDINYEIEGNGPWLTLSHSLACNLHMWDPQMPVLTKSFKVLRFDTRGHGQSSAPAGEYTLEQLADEPVVLVQSGLYPHAGYDERIQLLTPATLNDPAHVGAAVLIAPGVDAYPFNAGELAGLGTLQPFRSMASGIVISRLSDPHALTARR